MPSVLNITNGDSSVHIMRQAKVDGDFLPWRDVLHEGPVPGLLSLSELSAVRAEFISDRGWGQLATILDGFTERDNKLASCSEYDEVILWFEHDLYDQLQILQILDWFATEGPPINNLFIICNNQYLGLLSPEQMRQLLVKKVPVTKNMLSLASRAWLAYRKNSPQAWSDLLHSDLSALPYLKEAVIRVQQEYPSSANGLSRTACQVLNILSNEPLRAHEVFQQNQSMEESIFMGDSSFRVVLQELINSNPSLIATHDNKPLAFPKASKQQLTITDTGRKVLANDQDFLSLSVIDRWVGGVHLQAHSPWRWDAGSQTIISASVNHE
jgi:hypothetical protein